MSLLVGKIATLLGHEQFEIIKVTEGHGFSEQESTWVKVKDFAKNRWLEIEIIGDETRIITEDKLCQH